MPSDGPYGGPLGSGVACVRRETVRQEPLTSGCGRQRTRQAIQSSLGTVCSVSRTPYKTLRRAAVFYRADITRRWRIVVQPHAFDALRARPAAHRYRVRRDGQLEPPPSGQHAVVHRMRVPAEDALSFQPDRRPQKALVVRTTELVDVVILVVPCLTQIRRIEQKHRLGGVVFVQDALERRFSRTTFLSRSPASARRRGRLF